MANNMELIKQLRDMTQAGVSDVMKALKENNNDLQKAAQWLREKGIAKATKKAGAVVTEGVVKAIIDHNYAALVEINSQTDFVAISEDFKKLVNSIVEVIKNNKPTSLEQLNKLSVGNGTVESLCVDLTAKTGERIGVRKISTITKNDSEGFDYYEHFNGKIAVILLATSTINPEVGKSIAMHIAAMNPKFLSTKDVSQDWIKSETEVLKKQTLAEGKPAARVDMIVKGRINKSMSEVCLEQQQFIKDPTKKIKDYLKANNTTLIKFMRYEVGEGIEKKTTNFAAEVAQQMGK